MGQKTKIVNGGSASFMFLVIYLVSLSAAGCKQTTTTPPDIRVERVETSEWAGVTIYFDHHDQESNGGAHFVTLNSPEEIAVYKEKVEFLLSRLEETEIRMNIHEPEPEPTE
jgi:hypothetical protein